MNKRDKLRELCAERQDDLCVVCDRGLYGSGHLHEAIIKKGDLPKDNRIFVPENCCVIHEHCHKNTKEVDVKCIRWLINKYGSSVADFINSLNMKVLPGRAMDAIQRGAR